MLFPSCDTSEIAFLQNTRSLKLSQPTIEARRLAIATEMAANDVNEILVKLLAAAENIHGPVCFYLLS